MNRFINRPRKLRGHTYLTRRFHAARVKSAVRKCGAHFRFASVSGGKADIPKSTRWADCVEEVGRRGRSNFSASWKRFPNQNVEGRMAEHRQSNYEANKSRF